MEITTLERIIFHPACSFKHTLVDIVVEKLKISTYSVLVHGWHAPGYVSPLESLKYQVPVRSLY